MSATCTPTAADRSDAILSAFIRLSAATSPLPYLSVAFALVVLACLALVAVSAAYLYCLAAGASLLYTAFVAPAAASLRARYTSYVRTAAYRRLRAYATRCRTARLAREAAEVVPSVYVEFPYAALCIAPTATRLPTEARRTALPTVGDSQTRALPLASSAAGRFALPTVEAPAFRPAGLLSYRPEVTARAILSDVPAFVQDRRDDTGRAVTALVRRETAVARLATYKASRTSTAPSTPAAEESVATVACPPAADETPAAPLATALPLSERSGPERMSAYLDATRTERESARIDSLSYNDLRRECKAAGKKANGTAAVLRARLRGEAV